MPWSQFVDLVCEPPPDWTVKRKEGEPVTLAKNRMLLVKAATFPNDSRAKNEPPPTKATALFGDYDRGEMKMQEAAERLETFGLAAVLYTTPRHTPEAPRWRIVVPLATEIPFGQYRPCLAYVNALLGNVLAPESHTDKQCFFIGKIDGLEYEAIAVDGAPLSPSVAVVDQQRVQVHADALPGSREQHAGQRPPSDRDRSDKPCTAEQVFADKVAALGRKLVTGDERRAMLKSYIASRSARGLSAAEIRALLDHIVGVYFDPADPVNEADIDGLVQWARSKDADRPDIDRRPRMRFGPVEVVDPVTGEITRLDGATQATDPLLLDLDTVATSDGVDKEFVIERWLPDDTVTLFAAHGGTGKSYLSLLIAIRVALGLPLFGCAVRRCRVIVYSAEDDIAVMTARVKRYCVKYNIDPALLKGWLFIYDATESDNVLFTDGKAANHRTTDRYEWLKAKVEEHGAGLLILDNASDTYDASEIDRAKVRQFITVLKRIAPATLLLAHVDAVSAMAKMEDAKGYSGSTGWHNSVRSRWFMAADGEDIVLSLPKANYAAQGAQVVIRWNPLELLFEPLTTRDGPPKAADHADDLLRLFASVCGVKDISPAKCTDASVYGTLKALEGFPRGLTPAEVHNQVTRWIAQGLVTPVSVKKPNRTRKEVLRLTDKGRERLQGETNA
jgi:hypothetical protein